jgi:lysophospholipase L1-like esterase
VWANNSGTMQLDSSTATRSVNDPQTGETIQFREAVERYRPPTVVLSFGLNGIMHFSENPDEYLANYRKLIEKIRAKSPSTEVIVQSVYPVADLPYQADWKFSITPKEINERVNALNLRLEEACAQIEGTIYADTASAIKDADGFLPASLTTDGIHLTSEAYERILSRLEQEV